MFALSTRNRSSRDLTTRKCSRSQPTTSAAESETSSALRRSSACRIQAPANGQISCAPVSCRLFESCRRWRQQLRELRKALPSPAGSSVFKISQGGIRVSAHGLKVSGREVERRLHNNARAPGVTDVADASSELKAKAEVSAMSLRRSLRETEPAITRAQALTYYRRHRRLFERQELRYVDLAENFTSAALAARAKREVESGASLARISLHEVIERYNLTGREKERRAAEDAIFAARPHVLSGPIRVNRFYAIFEVTRIVPPRRRPFARVERSIESRLAREQRRRNLARLIGVARGRRKICPCSIDHRRCGA